MRTSAAARSSATAATIDGTVKLPRLSDKVPAKAGPTIWPKPKAPVISAGPYRWLRHPNYAVTLAETLLLPSVFGAFALGIIMTAVWAAVIRYKIALEDAALAERRPKA